MRRLIPLVFVFLLLATPAFAGEEMAATLNAMLQQGLEENSWQVSAADVKEWIDEGDEDLLVVDVRLNPNEYIGGHIPGAIYIPYNQILSPENLSLLSKDKTIVLVCVTGQVQNLPILALRVLGYDAYTMSFGHTSWVGGYFGGERMKQVIAEAGANNFPLVQ